MRDPQQPADPAQPAPAGNGLARTAFLVAAITVVLSLIGMVALPLIAYSGTGADYGVFTMFSAARSIILFVGYAAAFALGLTALRGGSGKVLAGIAIGVGGVGLLEILFSLISSALFSVL